MNELGDNLHFMKLLMVDIHGDTVCLNILFQVTKIFQEKQELECQRSVLR